MHQIFCNRLAPYLFVKFVHSLHARSQVLPLIVIHLVLPNRHSGMDCRSFQAALANPDHKDVKTAIITLLGFWIPAIHAVMTSKRTFVYSNETLAWE